MLFGGELLALRDLATASPRPREQFHVAGSDFRVCIASDKQTIRASQRRENILRAGNSAPDRAPRYRASVIIDRQA